MTVIRWFKS